MTNVPFPPFAEEEKNEAAEAAEATEETKLTKSGKPRKKPNRPMTEEDIQFVLQNVKNMSYAEIAEARGITKFQVNRVLQTVKKQLREAAGDDPVKKQKVEEYIKEHLSRPEDTRPGKGGGRRTSKVQKSIDSLVGDILSGL